jgi:DNA-binding NarL/FixJ family response regulator
LNAAQQLVKTIDIKAERAELFKGFDTVFIHLFPNFVREFNALFSEPDRIQLSDDNLLTTELRIFALIRLGVSDSEQISRILGYSIHTVYAYKTRVKNRSFLPNEAFEARVLAIQAA